MGGKNKVAPKFPGRDEQEKSTIRYHAGGEIVKKWLIKSTCVEAQQELKAVESILEALLENGIDTVEAALESVRLAGSISVYLCKDGIYAQRANRLNKQEGSDGSNS